MARPTLFNHPKFRRLCHELKMPTPHVLGHLELMWRVAYESGDAKIGDSTDIELAAEWCGDPGVFALKCESVGFIDNNDGVFHIHDLYDHAPEYVQRRLEAESRRKEKGLSISEVRRIAAQKSWDARRKQTDANGMQTDANGLLLQCNCNANDTTPAPAPAPALKHTVVSEETANDKARHSSKTRTRTQYTPEFELLWRTHSFGTKSKAFEEFKMMDSPPPITELEKILSEQVRLRTMRRKAEIFEDSLPHLERWIRDRRWESGIPKEEEFDEARKNMKVEAWAV